MIWSWLVGKRKGERDDETHAAYVDPRTIDRSRLRAPLPVAKERLEKPEQYADWTKDPDFPGKRQQAVRKITQALSAIATGFGHEKKTASTWIKKTAHGQSSIEIQRSRHGFNAYVNLCFVNTSGKQIGGPEFTMDRCVRLGKFYHETESLEIEPGSLYYALILQHPEILDNAMSVLKHRALPWLDSHHNGWRMGAEPRIAEFM